VKAFDSILTEDEAVAMDGAHGDLAAGEATDLSQVEKKKSASFQSAAADLFAASFPLLPISTIGRVEPSIYSSMATI
jgi:hypothetical protein